MFQMGYPNHCNCSTTSCTCVCIAGTGPTYVVTRDWDEPIPVQAEHLGYPDPLGGKSEFSKRNRNKFFGPPQQGQVVNSNRHTKSKKRRR